MSVRGTVSIVLLLAVALGAGVVAVEPQRGHAANATPVAAYPNPVENGDPGEFVALRFEEPTNVTGWTLTDG